MPDPTKQTISATEILALIDDAYSRWCSEAHRTETEMSREAFNAGWNIGVNLMIDQYFARVKIRN